MRKTFELLALVYSYITLYFYSTKVKKEILSTTCIWQLKFIVDFQVKICPVKVYNRF